jgi:2',3'-cyclic-nucleotide 2'-phosphodiesterase (5'-nucleotidase family)
MNKKLLIVLSLGAFLASCRSHYQLTGVERTRIVVDSRYDAQPDGQAAAFLAPYKHKVDSIMGPIVGEAAHNMTVARPESDLSNLLSDILMWAAPQYGENAQIGIYNIGGIRSDLTRGKVTYGDVLDIAPFENKICFITLNGEQLMSLFRQIAKRGGEGVSHGVNLVITADGQLVSARLNGQEIDPKADYRITTIDYLLGGNDGMTTLAKGTNVVSPQESRNNTRFIIMDYFREKAAKGEVVDSKVEGRIRIENYETVTPYYNNGIADGDDGSSQERETTGDSAYE